MVNLELIKIVLVVFGVLQIILFFKIWGMTNDVKKIKTRMVDTTSFSIQEAYVNGKFDLVFELSKAKFIKAVLEKYNAVHTYTVNDVEKNTTYLKVFNSEKEEFERILNKNWR